ncbi:hypothetical protein KsCSTR_19920 [Candidatus Kuenenia stuttgartiensis]|uniref:Uncharacterized protein n=1 Tax=Kuenenia stuttgartiensis TaxID=174633 RepID=Q1Q2M9_KUEST|nr:hypothetical protein KsCSTR_19920 [Candidatus Kuenenia stuttgartiensis]CAJ74270.1 unknown protein [Candidatus Kuenenia stuttgartiensis]
MMSAFCSVVKKNYSFVRGIDLTLLFSRCGFLLSAARAWLGAGICRYNCPNFS